MSNLLKIRTLIDRFMKGETTLEEERELYAFFREEEVPDDLLPLRSLFMGMEAIEVKEERGERKEERKRREERRWLSVAAIFLLLLCGGALLWHQQQEECVAYIYGKKCTDREVIMQELEHNIGTMVEGQQTVENQLNDIFNIN